LYDYGFLGYNSANMSEQEKKQKKEYDDYFKTRGHEISGWNKFKKVVVSNNLLDIWSLIDNYCKINGYSYDENQNIYARSFGNAFEFNLPPIILR
jgi:hypothetical protein